MQILPITEIRSAHSPQSLITGLKETGAINSQECGFNAKGGRGEKNKVLRGDLVGNDHNTRLCRQISSARRGWPCCLGDGCVVTPDHTGIRPITGRICNCNIFVFLFRSLRKVRRRIVRQPHPGMFPF